MNPRPDADWQAAKVKATGDTVGILIPATLLAAAGFLVSLGLTAAVKNWTRRRALVDHPNNRSLHSHPTPRGGGIGIVLPVSICLAFLAATETGRCASIGWIAALGSIVAFIGFIDDLRSLPAVARLLAQTVCAVILTAALGNWRVMAWPGLPDLNLGSLGPPLTVVLVVGLTNAYNFMDGIDGIAGTQGAIAGLGWVGIGWATQDPRVAIAGAVLMATSLGFLVFNWPPASIFMGDVGSVFLGFVLAALTVLAAPRSPATALAGVLFVWPFVFDTTLTLLRRARRGENLLSAHRSHLYQRLVLAGVSHRTVTMVYGTLALVGVGTGQFVARGVINASLAGGLSIAVLAAGLWMAVVWREHVPRKGTGPGGRGSGHFETGTS